MADVNNVEIQQQLNTLLTDQKRILRDNTRSLREQVDLTNQMVESLSKANISGDIVQKSNSLKNSLRDAAEEASKFSKNNQDMASLAADHLKETDSGFEGLLKTYGKATAKAGVWGAATGGFIEGVDKGINLLKTGLTGILSLSTSVVEGMLSIGKAILSIPFKIFNAFINEANRMRGEPLLAREFEETRKAFGDFGEDLSKHVIKGYRNLRGELAETGLSTFRVLGFMHERLKFVREQFEALGAVAHAFGREIALQAEHFAAYQKGLGLSGEMMKGLAQATQGSDKTFEETLRTTTNFTTNLGKQFGLSQKVIGRDIGEMTKDLKTFGSVGVRQMAQLSVFARKLGSDFKDLLGVVERFDNFEDAAESAARLAQAFGLNIDAMEMINAQDPAQRIEALRKAFFQTGKDITKLSRQERNYLAATAGIEDQALNAVFAIDKQGLSYEKITAAGQTAEQQQITQAEAMQRLSDSIERMIKSGHRTGGFFDRFVQGFRRGIRWSGEFRDVMRNIRRSLWQAEHAGRAVGRTFIKAFPGIKQFLDGMADFFSPKKFAQMRKRVVAGFSQFFKELSDPKTAKNALNNLLKALQKAFFGMEESQRGAMMNIIGGFKKMFGAIGRIILSSVKIALKSLSKFFKAITKVITGESTFVDAIKDAFGKAGEAGASALLDVWFEISKELGPVSKELWKSFKGLMNVLWGKIKGWWEGIDWAEVWKKTKKPLLAAAAIIFGPALIKGIAVGLGNVLVEGVKKALTGFDGKAIFGKFGSRLGGLAGAAIAITAAIGINNGLKKFEKDMDKSFGETERKLGASAAGIIDTITFGLLPNDLGLQMANAVAKAADALFKAMDDYFGKDFGTEFRKMLGQWLDFAGSVGEVIGAVFSGDKDRLKEASKDMGKKLLDYLKTNIKFVFTKLPGAALQVIVDFGAWVGETVFTVLQGAFEGLADMFSDVPVLGWLLKKLSQAYGGMASLFNKLPDLFRSVVDKIVAFGTDVNNAAKKINDKIQSLFKWETWLNLGRNIVGAIGEALKDLGDTITKPFEDAKDELFELFEISSPSKVFLSMGKDMVGGLKKGLGELPPENLMKDHGEKMVKDYKKLMDDISKISIGGSKVSFGNLIEINSTGSSTAAKAVQNIVKSTNEINKELSGISSVNLKPKLENLGKVLGLRGSDSLKIEHENFNVDINITVELDPTKLADAIVDTGKVIKSPKAPRK